MIADVTVQRRSVGVFRFFCSKFSANRSCVFDRDKMSCIGLGRCSIFQLTKLGDAHSVWSLDDTGTMNERSPVKCDAHTTPRGGGEIVRSWDTVFRLQRDIQLLLNSLRLWQPRITNRQPNFGDDRVLYSSDFYWKAAVMIVFYSPASVDKY